MKHETNLHTQRDLKILDACAGGNIEYVENILLDSGETLTINHPYRSMSYPEALWTLSALSNITFTLDTVDIRETSLAEIKGDYLNLDFKNKYDIIITNPPFSLSLPIIEKAIDEVKEGGYV